MVNIDPKKRAYLVEVLGEDEADKVCNAAETLTKALEADGVAYKGNDSHWYPDDWDNLSPILQDLISLRGEHLTVSDEVAGWFEEDLKEHKEPAALHVLDLLRGRALTQR